MKSEKESTYIKTIMYADVLAMAVQNLDEIPPSLQGALKAFLSCRQANSHLNVSQHGQEGMQYKNGVN